MTQVLLADIYSLVFAKRVLWKGVDETAQYLEVEAPFYLKQIHKQNLRGL